VSGRHDLGHDRDRDLLGRPAAERQADRRVQPREKLLGQAGFAQARLALLLRAPAPERADVKGATPKG
jgi:hypothetical protein